VTSIKSNITGTEGEGAVWDGNDQEKALEEKSKSADMTGNCSMEKAPNWAARGNIVSSRSLKKKSRGKKGKRRGEQ